MHRIGGRSPKNWGCTTFDGAKSAICGTFGWLGGVGGHPKNAVRSLARICRAPELGRHTRFFEKTFAR